MRSPLLTLRAVQATLAVAYTPRMSRKNLLEIIGEAHAQISECLRENGSRNRSTTNDRTSEE